MVLHPLVLTSYMFLGASMALTFLGVSDWSLFALWMGVVTGLEGFRLDTRAARIARRLKDVEGA